MRQRRNVHYAEDREHVEMSKDPQQILMEVLDVLKREVYQMGDGLSQEEMDKKVKTFLLTEKMAITVRASGVSGHGGFTTRAVKIGDVLGLLTSQIYSRTCESEVSRQFEDMTWDTDDEFRVGFVNSCCHFHGRLKTNEVRDCPSNSELRVVKVRC